MDDAQRVRFWLAVVAVTILNLSFWLFSGTPSGGPINVRIAHASDATQFEYTGRLEIRFDRNVFEGKTRGEALPQSPFRMYPALEGEWVVHKIDTIAFEPNAPPPPGYRY